jgi:hypothetical protein
MNNKEKDKTGQAFPLENNKEGDLELSFDEKWNKVLEEVENRELEEAKELFKEWEEEERLEKEYIKKYGKEPEARTPDGKVNKKYIEYVLRRDFGIEPDNDSCDPYENFSWGGLTGEEAFIGYWNCE